ncbi:hypothetical protein CEXT_496491 [Caerostris extrusa]|uniref:Uncharacterized protein n=1 Tax=Caerostris extrusa TaxID=172846 RepID=A0AAV4XZ93_CAEEX|nr:hypothetical protein CEXT_496491 [Caerostris extrusa]
MGIKVYTPRSSRSPSQTMKLLRPVGGLDYRSFITCILAGLILTSLETYLGFLPLSKTAICSQYLETLFLGDIRKPIHSVDYYLISRSHFTKRGMSTTTQRKSVLSDRLAVHLPTDATVQSLLDFAPFDSVNMQRCSSSGNMIRTLLSSPFGRCGLN